jgi:hypothetical protein
MYGGLNSDGTWNGMIGMVMRGVCIILSKGAMKGYLYNLIIEFKI